MELQGCELVYAQERYESEWCSTHYLSTMFKRVSNRIQGTSISFVVCSATDQLPKTKYNNKVILLCGDELGQGPAFDTNDPHILAIFRQHNHKINKCEKTYPMPMGYNTRSKLPGENHNKHSVLDVADVADVDARDIDILYIGNSHVPDRVRLLESLTNLKSYLDTKNTIIGTTPTFATGVHVQEFHSLLERTKIALVPRGGAPETYRFCEAAYHGCSIITTYINKDVWYYSDFPGTFITDWTGLSEELLETCLEEYTENSPITVSRWYSVFLSPNSLATYIASKLDVQQGF